MDKIKGYCRWYGEALKDITERDREKCYMTGGRECSSCPEAEWTKHKEETEEE